jgi:uncharacterized membrane protein YbhN (UPF0104 family)
LAEVPLRIREATIVQLAASFMSKILPGGIGATGLNARYLVKSGLDATEASALIVAQNLIGFVMFIVPLLIFLLIDGQSIGSIFNLHIQLRFVIIALAVVAILGVVLAWQRKLRKRVNEFVLNTVSSLRDITASPREITLAAASSLCITFLYVACLYASAHAFHSTLSISTAIIVYASAMIAKAAVPTPGGLGPVEVAMSVALIGAGIPHGQSLAIVLLYRLATFWVPVPFSILAYRYVMAKNIV